MSFYKIVVASSLALVSMVSSKSTTPWHKLEGYNFEAFEQEFGRSYTTIEERQRRKAIFEDRLKAIRQHNEDPKTTYKKGVNQFSDQHPDELTTLRGLDKSLLHHLKGRSMLNALYSTGTGDLPKDVDWREKGVVTPVKNQGFCGSCWTFASAETLESHWAIATGELQVGNNELSSVSNLELGFARNACTTPTEDIDTHTYTDAHAYEHYCSHKNHGGGPDIQIHHSQELSEQFILDCTPNDHKCGGTGGCGGGTAALAYVTNPPPQTVCVAIIVLFPHTRINLRYLSLSNTLVAIGFA